MTNNWEFKLTNTLRNTRSVSLLDNHEFISPIHLKDIRVIKVISEWDDALRNIDLNDIREINSIVSQDIYELIRLYKSWLNMFVT